MKNADYWAGRMERLNENLMQKADALLPDIQKAYETAAENIQQQIEAFYQRYAGQEGISLAEAKRLLSPKERQRFGMTIEGYIKAAEQGTADPKWIRQMERTAARARVSRLEALRLQMHQQIELLEGWKDMAMTRTLGEIFQECFYQTGYEIQRGLGVGAAFATLDTEQISRVLAKPWSPDGKNFSARIWGDERGKLLHTLETTVTTGIITGESPQRTIDKVRKAMGSSRAAAGRLVLTEGAAFAAMGRKECYERLGVKQFAFLATLDAKTCGVCADMDGQVFDLEDYAVGVTAPPLHPFDRCTTVPHFDDEFSAGDMRAARDGDGKTYYVPAGMSYQEWKKTFIRNKSKDDVIAGAVLRLARDYNSEFGKKFGKEHYDQIRDRVDNCKVPALQKLWDKYEGQIKVADPHHKGGALCQGDSIYIGIDSDAKARKYFAPYSTVFHECGHAIDGLVAQLGSANGQWHFSSTYKNALFPKTIKQEVEEWVSGILADMKAHKADLQYWVKRGWISPEYAAYCEMQIGFKVTKKMAYDAVKREIQSLGHLQMGDISDILEGATCGGIMCGVGHGGSSYWTKRTFNGIEWGLGTEAFAEMTSAIMACPESLAVIQKYLPKSYALYEEMLEFLVNQL